MVMYGVYSLYAQTGAAYRRGRCFAYRRPESGEE